ncbi:MAG: DnaJ domain-containing protein [Planctomycetales bacterium]|nr:DnaJ domain-containing protein [Planctomycetales bacterium]
MSDADGNRRSLSALSGLATFGLKADCTEQDLRTAYRQLAQQCHPDHGGSPEAFRQLQDDFERALRFIQKRGLVVSGDRSHDAQLIPASPPWLESLIPTWLLWSLTGFLFLTVILALTVTTVPLKLALVGILALSVTLSMSRMRPVIAGFAGFVVAVLGAPMGILAALGVGELLGRDPPAPHDMLLSQMFLAILYPIFAGAAFFGWMISLVNRDQ